MQGKELSSFYDNFWILMVIVAAFAIASLYARWLSIEVLAESPLPLCP
jgi:hypothetical protein